MFECKLNFDVAIWIAYSWFKLVSGKHVEFLVWIKGRIYMIKSYSLFSCSVNDFVVIVTVAAIVFVCIPLYTLSAIEHVDHIVSGFRDTYLLLLLCTRRLWNMNRAVSIIQLFFVDPKKRVIKISFMLLLVMSFISIITFGGMRCV